MRHVDRPHVCKNQSPLHRHRSIARSQQIRRPRQNRQKRRHQTRPPPPRRRTRLRLRLQGSIVPLPREVWRERSGQKSAEAIGVGVTSRSADEHSKVAGSLTQRRAELHGSVPTAWRTVKPPITPDGAVEPRVVMMGSMWAFSGGLRPASYAGLSRVRAERPNLNGSKIAVALLLQCASPQVIAGADAITGRAA
jgi:hypothetical protein